MDIYSILTSKDWHTILKDNLIKYDSLIKNLHLKNPIKSRIKEDYLFKQYIIASGYGKHTYQSFTRYILDMDKYPEFEEILIGYFGKEIYEQYLELQNEFVEVTNSHPIKELRSYFNLTQAEIGNIIDEKRGIIYFYEKQGVIKYDKLEAIIEKIRHHIDLTEVILKEEIVSLPPEEIDVTEIYSEFQDLYPLFENNYIVAFNKKLRGIIRLLNKVINVEIEDLLGFKQFVLQNLVRNDLDLSSVPVQWKDFFQVIYILFRMLFQPNQKVLSSKIAVIKSILNSYIIPYKKRYKGYVGEIINNFLFQKSRYLKRNPVYMYREYHKLSRNEFAQISGITLQETRYIENFNDYRSELRDILLQYIPLEELEAYEQVRESYFNELSQHHIIFKLLKKHKLSMMDLSLITKVPISNIEHYIKQFQIPNDDLLKSIIKRILVFEKSKKEILKRFYTLRIPASPEEIVSDSITWIKEIISFEEQKVIAQNLGNDSPQKELNICMDTLISRVSDAFYYYIEQDKKESILNLFLENKRESNISEKYIIGNYECLKTEGASEDELIKAHPYYVICNHFGITILQLSIILDIS